MKKSIVVSGFALVLAMGAARGQSFTVIVTNGYLSGGDASFEVSAPGVGVSNSFTVEGSVTLTNWYTITNNTQFPTNGLLSVTTPYTNDVMGFRATVGSNDSVNGLGFVTVPILANTNLIANQINKPGGNTLSNLLSGLPAGTSAFKWNAVAQDYIHAVYRSAVWNTNLTFGPGEGLILIMPAGSSSLTNWFIGDLEAGSLSANLYTNGTLVSAFWPRTGDINSVQDYSATVGDSVCRYSFDGLGRLEYSYFTTNGWSPSVSPRPAEGFWYFSTTNNQPWSATTSVW
jgi:hypothetical protein